LNTFRVVGNDLGQALNVIFSNGSLDQEGWEPMIYTVFKSVTAYYLKESCSLHIQLLSHGYQA